jgi:hypothetical protein
VVKTNGPTGGRAADRGLRCDHREDILTTDETQCLMTETYASPEALSAHMGNVGHLLGTLFESGGSVDVNILGDASEALIGATKDFQPTMYSLLASA